MSGTRVGVLLAGMVAGDPHQGGATWAVLQYVLGLRRLGHDVVLVEPVRALSSETTRYFREVVGRFGLDGRAALLDAERHTVGLPYARLREAASGADVLLNISGLLRDEGLTAGIPIRAYLDLDPAFTQLWHAQGSDVGLDGHTRYVTVGRSLASASPQLPTCGVEWTPTFPPVVLEHWPAATALVHDAFTTVANWRSYGSIEHNGRLYGQKAHSLRPLISLPTRTRERFLLALGIHPDERDDLRALAANGWQLVDPLEVAGTPDAYRSFVAGSRAELGVAKSGYVESRCGWFSDRSACYLACGRPVLAQDTGFGDALPTGEGLFAFRTIDDALAGIESLAREPARHARAARDIAEAYLDSDKVLGRLMEAVGATASGVSRARGAP